MELGVSLVQFGCILILNLGIGLITPPVGGVLYIGSAISGIKVNKLFKSMLPLYGIMVIALMLITFVPDLSLWLPKILGYTV
jgi:TRAP-type C4-dicarboxylate transport system permease large subunit